MDTYISDLTLEQMVAELQMLSDGLIKRSLSQYVAYSLKEVEAAAYVADPKADVPNLKAEAELRGVKLGDLAKSVLDKSSKMKAVISGIELLRLELASRFPQAPNKYDLREEILNKAKALIQAN